MGDVVAAREPNSRPIRHMLQELFETCDAGRPADDAQMQADRQHAWHRGGLLVEPVEGITAVAGKVLGKDESAVVEKAHVVGIESVGQHDMGAPEDGFHVGKIVVVGVEL